MKPIYHVTISAAVSVVLIVWFKSWHAAIACFLGGVFIDLDHPVDYFLAKKEIPLSYSDLFKYGAYDKEGKLYLFFHSYELLLIFWLLIYYLHLDWMWIGLAVGVSSHMLCDQIVNPLRPLAYFFLYRMKHGFKRKYIFTKAYFEQIP